MLCYRLANEVGIMPSFIEHVKKELEKKRTPPSTEKTKREKVTGKILTEQRLKDSISKDELKFSEIKRAFDHVELPLTAQELTQLTGLFQELLRSIPDAEIKDEESMVDARSKQIAAQELQLYNSIYEILYKKAREDILNEEKRVETALIRELFPDEDADNYEALSDDRQELITKALLDAYMFRICNDLTIQCLAHLAANPSDSKEGSNMEAEAKKSLLVTHRLTVSLEAFPPTSLSEYALLKKDGAKMLYDLVFPSSPKTPSGDEKSPTFFKASSGSKVNKKEYDAEMKKLTAAILKYPSIANEVASQFHEMIKPHIPSLKDPAQNMATQQFRAADILSRLGAEKEAKNMYKPPEPPSPRRSHSQGGD